MRRGHRVILLSLVLFTAGIVLASWPGAGWAGQPTDHLRAQIDRVLKLLEDPEMKKESKAAERRKAVRKIAEEIFDFGETAKRSLARHWPARTPAEREEFVRLFADLLERSYITKIELFNGEKIQYVGEQMDGELATVRTRIVTKQGTEIPVDYRMLKRGNRWLVYDVSIEGVSLIANYRTQFNKIIQTSSYQELVKKMKTKQEEFLEQDKQRRTS
ncbi:MAG: ABC transporter substrate-binding protein [Candidatus Rokubacteria bacterium]|nr:ABC transporter substrate-binding protein [Candidatus Rokubacteria bacterium]